MPTITVNQERCTRCGGCVAVCAIARVFELEEHTARAVRPEACWLCGHCVAVCPVDAIRHPEYPLQDCPTGDARPSYEELLTAFQERRSLRVYRDESVQRDIVRQLVDASRWAPSASNQRPVDWIAIDSPDHIARISTAVATTLARIVPLLRNPLLRPFLSLFLGKDKISKAVQAADNLQRLGQERARGRDPIFYEAPVLLVAHVPESTFFGREDAVYAAYNVMLAAERLGLGTCHIGYVNAALERDQGLARAIGVPPQRKLQVVLTLGYPAVKFRKAIPRPRMHVTWNPSHR